MLLRIRHDYNLSLIYTLRIDICLFVTSKPRVSSKYDTQLLRLAVEQGPWELEKPTSSPHTIILACVCTCVCQAEKNLGDMKHLLLTPQARLSLQQSAGL